ncbi:hypothetical protein [Mucilaginibacter sp. SP1R1]|uniref:hypothetical protein n=1 Tax=Mucilaginibacter sp. SP1R1 TaxID=2723091 RepID=UPI0016070DAA|nr:hypothetical protein [Mucilaginibacter sp. SP1R1]MBB6150011.1 DNA replication protein DnaC [Mucilaginibacter sp. SP1R1]
MLIKHVASVNIIRDQDSDIHYITTPNARLIANQIANDFKKGARSFNIIGSYGTGKSAFLLAFEKSLLGRASYLDANFGIGSSYHFMNIVGEFRSLQEVLSEYLALPVENASSQEIFSEIFNRFYDLKKSANAPVLYLIIDEFGKFLEYAVRNEPENGLYFIQQLAEFINNPENNIILVTTTHQNFDAYVQQLNLYQKQEWTKIKGRFRELAFNEPVEQLLFLASEQLAGKPDTKLSKQSLDIFIKTRAFRHDGLAIQDIASKLYPLDITSAYVLTLAIQRYGQNERSLFSFLASSDHTGIDAHLQTLSTYFSLAHVYDYLIYNFYSFINSVSNPDLSAWKSIRGALELIEKRFETNIGDYAAIIKCIGLLNIFAENGALLNGDFLTKYASVCLGIRNSEKLIGDLEKKNIQIIAYRNYATRYVLAEGTDLDISSELLKASNKIDPVSDITGLLRKYYNLPPVIAKEVTYRTGTPRLFEYLITAYPQNIAPFGETDGYINLIFNDASTIEEIIAFSAGVEEPILYGFYQNAAKIKELLFEIEKTKKVLEENVDDKVAVRELNNIILHQQNLLNHRILNHLYNNEREVVWIYRGNQIGIPGKRAFNNILSEMCYEVYFRSPVLQNELINKHKLSGSIHTAKKIYLKALVNDWDKENMGFSSNKFPPEKTIYMALLLENDIRLHEDENTEIIVSERNNFHWLWEISMQFIEGARTSKRKISEFHDLLSKKPYKLKQGLIDFWVPTFLFIKRNDFALFSDGRYVPNLNADILELMLKDPGDYEIKAFDIAGVKLNLFNSYRKFLQQSVEDSPGNSSFIETIKPFLVFYKGLPEYSKNTKRLSNEALQIREVISRSKEPEQTFFEAFPVALGYSLNRLQEYPNELPVYINKLQDAIKELRTSYDELIGRVEVFIQTEIIGEALDFEDYKAALQARFKTLKKHLLLQVQRRLVQRIDSEIEDRKAWFNSLSQALIGCTLDEITDEQELSFYDRFKNAILELDSLTLLSNSNVSKDKEDLLSVEISSFDTNLSKRVIRLPKSKGAEVILMQDLLRKSFSKDASINLAALANLLKEMMSK